MSVAQNVNRGVPGPATGRLPSVIFWKSRRRYVAATRRPMRRGDNRPVKPSQKSTRRSANDINGTTISLLNFSRSATPSLSNDLTSSGHALAKAPLVIEPPDTLDEWATLPNNPASLRRHSAPRWKSIARNPPPDTHTA